MLSLALLTRNSVAAQAVEQIIQESDVFRLSITIDPSAPMQESIRSLSLSKPEVILADLADWEMIDRLRKAGFSVTPRIRWIGFAPDWDLRQELIFTEAGVCCLLHEPFGPKDLEKAVFDAFHETGPEVRSGLWAFLPSKAGGGCSTLVLNTAGALRQLAQKDVLVIEADARSGSYALLMNLTPRRPINEALEFAAEMTPLEWHNFHTQLDGVHLLTADPAKPGRLPSWPDYYHLLRFLESRYNKILVDLPEIVNDATAEVVRRAENVFVVCTPEIPSLKMTAIRCQDLLNRGVQRERIRLLVTRFKRDELSLRDIEKNLGWPVYATLANDYRSVRSSILEARLISPESSFGRDCRMLAQMLLGIPADTSPVSTLGKLSKLIGK